MHEKKCKGRDKAREMEGDASTNSAAEVEADEDGGVGGRKLSRGWRPSWPRHPRRPARSETGRGGRHRRSLGLTGKLPRGRPLPPREKREKFQVCFVSAETVRTRVKCFLFRKRLNSVF